MYRLTFTILVIISLTAFTSRAQSLSEKATGSSGSLPAGHPDPGLTGTPGVTLPAGHPDISAMVNKSASTTQPQTATGSILIRATQGSSNGPAISSEPFTLELLIHGQLFDKVEGKLDDKGTATVNGIPLRLSLEPVVKVTHGGAQYQAVGQAMDSSTPEQEVQVNVYETTDKRPEWKVRMRHVMVEHVQDKLQVMEMLAISNPGDRAWIGDSTSDGRRATFTLLLPEQAQHIQVLGDYASSAVLDENKLINTGALAPGDTQYQVLYELPIIKGKADITITAPAPINNLIVFLPDDGSIVKAQGVDAMGSADMGKGKMRYYKGADLTADRIVNISVSGIVDVQRTSPAGLSGSSTRAAQVVAGAGAVLILLFGIAFLLLKGTGGASSAAK